MGTVYGVNATKAATPTGANDIAAGQQFAGVRVVFDSYEFSSTDAGTIVRLGGRLPAGHRCVGMHLATDALGSSTTIKIGDTNNDDLYFAASSTASAVSTSSVLVDGLGYVIGTNAGDDLLIATLSGAAGTGTLKLAMFFAY